MKKDDKLLAKKQQGADPEYSALIERAATGTLKAEDRALIASGSLPPEIKDRILFALLKLSETFNFLKTLSRKGPITIRIMRENEALRGLVDELSYRLQHDALTGLPNRKRFDQVLFDNYNLCLEKGGSICVFFLDLDKFKRINDELGHDVGDELLVAVAQRLQRDLKLHEHDLLARIMTSGGGDEFGIILRNVSKDDAKKLATRLYKKLGGRYRLRGKHLTIRASIGIAYRRIPKLSGVPQAEVPDLDDVKQAIGVCCRSLLSAADSALRAAKEAGGGFHLHVEDKRRTA